MRHQHAWWWYFSLLVMGFRCQAIPYDYSGSMECLENPWEPQYGGGIITNPELKHGLTGWSAFGNAAIATTKSPSGNEFAIASARTQPHDSISQKLYLRRNQHYTVSAWVRVSEGKALVRATVKRGKGSAIHAASVYANSKCWSMLKGGFSLKSSGRARLYFESENPSVEIWIDSVSLQPFTKREWNSHQLHSLNQARKAKLKIEAVDSNGNPMRNATVTFHRKKLSFPFGCAMNKNILGNQAYQDWFTKRFNVATFEDEMKWYSNEPSQGREDYTVSDEMIGFCEKNGIDVRGHNVLWNDPKYQPGWVTKLSDNDLSAAADNRVNSVVTRYKGRVIHWDVVNENLHFNFLESNIGPDASGKYFNKAHAADLSPILFMNEFNTLEDSRDGMSGLQNYLEKLRQIRAYPGNENIQMGIGLEGHFKSPNLAYIRSVLDALGASGLPIWLTEIDVQSRSQAQDLERILREVHSHPKVKGIVLWSAWKPEGCYRMCLTDNNFNNLATGDVVDKLIAEWGGSLAAAEFTGTTDDAGAFETSLFHGDYEARVLSSSAQSLTSSSASKSFKVDSSTETQTFVLEASS